ncbi:hypothetical protein EMIT0P253_130004 [Pseudomonas sp. IT-P253]
MAGGASTAGPVDWQLPRRQRHPAQGQGLRHRADVGEHPVLLLPRTPALGTRIHVDQRRVGNNLHPSTKDPENTPIPVAAGEACCYRVEVAERISPRTKPTTNPPFLKTPPRLQTLHPSNPTCPAACVVQDGQAPDFGSADGCC